MRLRKLHRRDLREHRGLLVENHSGDPVDEPGLIEVQDQSDLAAGKSHVTKQLRLVNTLDFFDSFHFDDHLPFDVQVNSITGIDRDSFVGEGKRDLK